MPIELDDANLDCEAAAPRHFKAGKIQPRTFQSWQNTTKKTNCKTALEEFPVDLNDVAKKCKAAAGMFSHICWVKKQ